MSKYSFFLCLAVFTTAFSSSGKTDNKVSPLAFVTVDSLIFSDLFETDQNGDGRPDNWVLNDHVLLDTSLGYSGSSMKIVGQDQGKTKAISNSITVEPHQTYRLSWWCRTEEVIRYVLFSARLGEGRVDFETEYQGGSWNWLYHEAIFNSEDETECQIFFQLSSPGMAWIDDVKLERYEKPLDSDEVIRECANILYREGDSVAVWVNYPAVKIFREDLLWPEIPCSDTITIRMAKNEYEPFQLVIHPVQDLSFLTVSVSDLNGPVTISSKDITVNTVHYVKIEDQWITHPDARRGNHPDALPWEHESTAPGGFHTPFWITLKTPSVIPAGDYIGKIMVTGSSEWEFPLKVSVWDFTLPANPRLDISASDAILHGLKIEFFDTRLSEERFADFARNLVTHRISGTRYVAAKLQDEDWVKIISDSLDINFSLLDQVVQEYSDFGFRDFLLSPHNLAASSRPLGETLWLGLTPLTDDFNWFFTEYCRKIGSYLAGKGWLDRAFFMLWDEPNSAEYADVRAIYDLVRKGDSRLKLTLSEEPVPELNGVVDIWYPNLRRVSINEIMDRVQEQKSAGNIVGAYGNNRYSMLYPLAYQRLWPWTLKKYGLTCTGWWSVLSESKETSVWENPVIVPQNANKSSGLFPGHAFFLYFDPDGNGPFVNSMRWEALREGAEDYEYLVELENRLELVSPGMGRDVVQSLVDSLVWDNMGELFESSMRKLHAVRNSVGDWISSLEEPTGVSERIKKKCCQRTSAGIRVICTPNPFNESTLIYLESSVSVQSISVYDIRGRQVRTLLERNQESGVKTIVWDGRDDLGNPVSSGIYILACKNEYEWGFQRVVLVR